MKVFSFILINFSFYDTFKKINEFDEYCNILYFIKNKQFHYLFININIFIVYCVKY